MVKWVILTSHRSGSTFLQTSLDSHQDILSVGEILAKKDSLLPKYGIRNYDPKKDGSVEGFLLSIYKNSTTTIFKCMYNQANIYNIYDFLIKNKVLVIHLIRRDQIARAVSKHMAHKKKGYKIRKDPMCFVERAHTCSNIINKVRKNITDNFIEVFYEDMIGKKSAKIEVITAAASSSKNSPHVISSVATKISENTAARLCRFLKVDNKDLYSFYSKKSPINYYKCFVEDKKAKNIFFRNEVKII